MVLYQNLNSLGLQSFTYDTWGTSQTSIFPIGSWTLLRGFQLARILELQEISENNGFLIIFPRVGIKDRHISGFETSPSPFQINFPMPNTSSAVVGGTRAAAVERRHCRDLYGAVGG